MGVALGVVLGLLGAAALFDAAPVQAQVERSGGGEAQRFMQQYQQISAEKASLQNQLTQMKKDLDAANAQLATVMKERDTAKAHVGVPPSQLAQANSAKESAERSLEKTRQQIAELVSRFRETATNLRDVEADRSKLREDLAKRDAALDQCAEDNLQLYEITGEVLDRYERVGLFTKVSAAEPFTKITRTRIENLVDEYRERAQQLRLKKAVAGAPAAPPKPGVPAQPAPAPASGSGPAPPVPPPGP
jgi:chromosome segregation ATPase